MCNKDCFNCKYEDCICDDDADVREAELSDQIDASLLTANQIYYRKQVERKRKYYQDNKDRLCAYQRKYYRDNKEQIAARMRRPEYAEKKRQYAATHKDALAKSKKEYFTRNKSNPSLIDAGMKLITARKKKGLSQDALAKLVGISQTTISFYERALAPYDAELFAVVLPEVANG